MSDEIYNLMSYILISSYRKKVLTCLANSTVKMPSKIARECGLRQNHISKVLNELKNKNLVVCVNPEIRKGRLYKITETGEQIIELINQSEKDMKL